MAMRARLRTVMLHAHLWQMLQQIKRATVISLSVWATTLLVMRMVNLAHNRPHTINFEQVKKVGEAES